MKYRRTVLRQERDAVMNENEETDARVREAFFPPVEVDTRKSPGLVFFQDRETRYTVVIDAATGEQLGRSVCAAPPMGCTAATHGEGRTRVLRAVKGWLRFSRRGAAVAAYRAQRRKDETA